MNMQRIKEIHEGTAYPESRSVLQALLKVWNESSVNYDTCSECGCEFDSLLIRGSVGDGKSGFICGGCRKELLDD